MKNCLTIGIFKDHYEVELKRISINSLFDYIKDKVKTVYNLYEEDLNSNIETETVSFVLGDARYGEMEISITDNEIIIKGTYSWEVVNTYTDINGWLGEFED